MLRNSQSILLRSNIAQCCPLLELLGPSGIRAARVWTCGSTGGTGYSLGLGIQGHHLAKLYLLACLEGLDGLPYRLPPMLTASLNQRLQPLEARHVAMLPSGLKCCSVVTTLSFSTTSV